MNQSTSIMEIKGIGEKTAALFQKLNIETVGDLLLHYPRTYVQFPVAKEVAEVTDGETAAVLGRVRKTPVVRRTRSMPVTVTTIGTDEAELELVWFRMPYIKSQLAPGNTYVFYGKVARKGSRLVMEQAAIYSGEAYAAMEQAFLPVYGLTGGISNNLVTKTVGSVLGREELFKEYLPREIRSRYKLCEYNYAIKEIHFPENMDTLIAARNRLVFDEFFLFILNMQYHKEKRIKEANEFEFREDSFTDELIARLPYELTGAQKRALSEVKRDMRSPYVMQRLIQGDVGSGKTIIAFLAMADAAHNDYQSAIMAPTEVLARQHYENLQALYAPFGIETVLLTGSMTAAAKRKTYSRIENHEADVIIGTQALFQEKAVYEQILATPEEPVSGTVAELAQKYNMELTYFVGFLDGINDSLKNPNPIEDMDANTVVSLDYDKEKLYYNMVAAKADWLYGLEQWSDLLTSERRKELYKEQRSSTTVVKPPKIGRNDPCPCGSGKKYKKCCGRNN